MPYIHDRDAILEAWSAGQSSSTIAERVGTSSGYIRTVIKKAREDGDSRAQLRRRKSTAPIEQRSLDHNAILDRWHAGWPAAEIARFAHTSPGTIYDLVMGYRRRGEPRAARRRRKNPAQCKAASA